MRTYALVFLSLVCAASGCGLRSVPPPATAAGYSHVEIKDVSALGLHDRNVEVVATLGQMGTDDSCGGMIVYALTDGGAQVQLSLPRSRYAEVRDLKMFQRVRVRGYLSHSLAQGCSSSSSDGNGRYLWVYLWADSIAPL